MLGPFATGRTHDAAGGAGRPGPFNDLETGEQAVPIRTYQPGDEGVQAEIYNEAAAGLPKFTPAKPADVARRSQAPDFDPATRFVAEEGGRPVGYATAHANGRVSFPWCRPGAEGAAEPLFQHALQALAARGQRRAFAAYRNDWDGVKAFFLAHGFRQAREVVNFSLDPIDMPTRPGSRKTPLTPLRPADLPAILEMGAGVLRVASVAELERHLFQNPYFRPDALFVLRSRADDRPLAVGILVAEATYADPDQVDPAMPCYRLGAFGTEGMPAKRVNGLFSFLTRDQRDVTPLALDLMGHAALRFDETGGGTLAAQVASDAAHLLHFYQRYFRRQGSFPVFECGL
jgi:hypothetical protein